MTCLRALPGGDMFTVQSLESRTLRSVSLHDGVVHVTGSADVDNVEVELHSSNPAKLDVTLNNVTTTYDTAGIIGIRIDGGDGNDRIFLGDGYPDFAIPATVRGSAGDDFFRVNQNGPTH